MIANKYLNAKRQFKLDNSQLHLEIPEFENGNAVIDKRSNILTIIQRVKKKEEIIISKSGNKLHKPKVNNAKKKNPAPKLIHSDIPRY